MTIDHTQNKLGCFVSCVWMHFLQLSPHKWKSIIQFVVIGWSLHKNLLTMIMYMLVGVFVKIGLILYNYETDTVFFAFGIL